MAFALFIAAALYKNGVTTRTLQASVIVDHTFEFCFRGYFYFREHKIKAKAQTLLGGDVASDLWDAVDAADPVTLDERLWGHNNLETRTKQAAD